MLNAFGTLTVQLQGLAGVTYLGFDYEGDEPFAALVDYCSAKEFGSIDDAMQAIELAKWQGLKFNNYLIF